MKWSQRFADLGGCPYAPGARGNICSEDAIHMPDVVGHTVPGQVAKSGCITDLHPAPAYVHELKKELA